MVVTTLRQALHTESELLKMGRRLLKQNVPSFLHIGLTSIGYSPAEWNKLTWAP